MILRMMARCMASPKVADFLIERSKRTPYSHLDGYMNRWWLFNPYEKVEGLSRFRFLPFSVRVHHILRKDLNRHPHDHPWDARTFILRGWYTEERENGSVYSRFPGDTATLRFGEFHNISEVSEGGVFTLFVTFGYRGTWGFKVDGAKVPWRKYLGIEQGEQK